MSSLSSSEEGESNPIALLSAEIKELRNKIICVKKSVSKGDKKQKKAIQDELAELEGLLTSKQDELQKMKILAANGGDGGEENELLAAAGEREKYAAKAKEKRERRREEKEAEWEANRLAALAEIANRPDYAQEESKAFAHRLAESGYRIVEIAADGHCLFSAIGCQLDPAMDHWEMRAAAASHLRTHRPDFEHFIDYDSVGIVGGEDCEDCFVEYCRRIESTGMWGGQVELEALSRALDISITVIQSNGPELVFNKSEENNNNINMDNNRKSILLSYHRFAFSLGEHYNALLPLDN